MHAATAIETSKGAQRHDHSPGVSQDRRSGGDGSSGCARNRPRPGRAQMEDAVDVAGGIGQPEDLRGLGEEDKGSQRRSASRSSRWRLAHRRLQGNARRDAQRGARFAITAARLTSRARSPAWRCSATSTAVSRPPTRCRCGSSTAAARNRPRYLQTLQHLLCRSGLVGRRIGPGQESRCARLPISRASRCGFRKASGRKSGAAPALAS